MWTFSDTAKGELYFLQCNQKCVCVCFQWYYTCSVVDLKRNSEHCQLDETNGNEALMQNWFTMFFLNFSFLMNNEVHARNMFFVPQVVW